MVIIFKKTKEKKKQQRREDIFKEYKQLIDRIESFCILEEANFKVTHKLKILFAMEISDGKTRDEAIRISEKIEKNIENIIENGIHPTEIQIEEFERNMIQLKEETEIFLQTLQENVKTSMDVIKQLETTKKNILNHIADNTFYPEDIAKKTFKIEETTHDIKRIIKTNPLNVNFEEYQQLIQTVEEQTKEFYELYHQTVQFIEKMEKYEQENEFKNHYEDDKKSKEIPKKIKEYLENKEKLYFSLHKGQFEKVKNILKSLEE